MFGLTRQERQALLFIAAIGLISICVRFGLQMRVRGRPFLALSPDVFRVDVNEAGLAELTDIAGISRGLAKNILAYRAAHGPLRSIEELQEVKGVGEQRYNQLKEVLLVR